MVKIDESHTLTVDGSNLILTYTSIYDAGTIRIVFDTNSTVVIAEDGTVYASLRQGTVIYSLNYTTNTNLSPTSNEDYANKINQLTNDPVDRLVIAQGNISNKSIKRVYGKAKTMGTTWRIVWGLGSSTAYTFLTSASTLEAISSNANDTSAGTGARTIMISGLDSSFNEITEVLSMNGTSATSATSNSFYRVNEVSVNTTGTYGGTNFGNITLRVSGAGASLAYITGDETVGTSSYGDSKSNLGIYSVPTGKTAFITGLRIYVEGNKSINIVLYKREDIGTTSAPQKPRTLLWSGRGIENDYVIEFDSYIVINGESDIFLRAQTGTGTADVIAGFDMLIVDDI